MQKKLNVSKNTLFLEINFFSLMRFHSFWKFNIFQKVSRCQSLIRFVSMQAKEQNKSPGNSLGQRKKMKNQLYVPILANDRLQALNDITSVTLGMDHVSWAKISVPTLTLLEWNAYTLPSDFRDDMEEPEILTLFNKAINKNEENIYKAHSVKQKIPTSQLYVIEKQKRWINSLNEIHLRTFLVVLLNNLNEGEGTYDKVVLQKPFVLNILQNLLIGNERKSAKQIVLKMLEVCKIREDEPLENTFDTSASDNYDCYSLIKISRERIHSFGHYEIGKQEGLSIALLTALTFLDVNVFQNPKSISKIKEKLRIKNIKHLSK